MNLREYDDYFDASEYAPETEESKEFHRKMENLEECLSELIEHLYGDETILSPFEVDNAIVTMRNIISEHVFINNKMPAKLPNIYKIY